MAREIEHKFLVRRELLPKLSRGRAIVQGYLSVKPTVRVRVSRNRDRQGAAKAYLTIKGPGLRSHDEFEYAIPVADARKLLKLCRGAVLRKIRYELNGWEIDEFLGRHKGLWLAEYELKSERAKLPKLPEWVGLEVTGDARYSNASLAMSGSELR
jgi:CYTH domain-containing protein